jgi:hypothetical protein
MTTTPDEYRMEAREGRQQHLRRYACQCGGDMPGRCPGPANCPMCQEDEEDADEVVVFEKMGEKV